MGDSSCQSLCASIQLAVIGASTKSDANAFTWIFGDKLKAESSDSAGLIQEFWNLLTAHLEGDCNFHPLVLFSGFCVIFFSCMRQIVAHSRAELWLIRMGSRSESPDNRANY